jgi:hypothetical protein
MHVLQRALITQQPCIANFRLRLFLRLIGMFQQKRWFEPKKRKRAWTDMSKQMSSVASESGETFLLTRSYREHVPSRPGIQWIGLIGNGPSTRMQLNELTSIGGDGL